MRATIMYGAGDVRIENVPDPSISDPTDAIIRVIRALHLRQRPAGPTTPMEPSETGQSMGHEAIGVVEEIGAEVGTVKRGDVVVMPFAYLRRHLPVLPGGAADRLRTWRLLRQRRHQRRPGRGAARARMPTGRSTRFRSARTMRSCRRCSRCRT